MSRTVQVTFDCHDPNALAGFWNAALGYEYDAPPPGFATWEEALDHFGVPEEERNSASASVDPEGVGPRLWFQRVPEDKVVKNRLHLDLRPADQAAEVARLEGLGATRTSVGQGPEVSWVTMADPDGNEFDVLAPR
jgi:hypothetical protein